MDSVGMIIIIVLQSKRRDSNPCVFFFDLERMQLGTLKVCYIFFVNSKHSNKGYGNNMLTNVRSRPSEKETNA